MILEKLGMQDSGYGGGKPPGGYGGGGAAAGWGGGSLSNSVPFQLFVLNELGLGISDHNLLHNQLNFGRRLS